MTKTKSDGCPSSKTEKCAWQTSLSSDLIASMALLHFIPKSSKKRSSKTSIETYPEQVHQRHQRRHTTPLAAPLRSRTGKIHHQTHRRWMDHRFPPDQKTCELCRRRGIARRISDHQEEKQNPLDRIHQPRKQATQSKGEIVAPPPIIDINSLFDVQVKRIHEYKRQLMNILTYHHVVPRNL